MTPIILKQGVGNHVIKWVESAIYLFFILDEKLKWNKHEVCIAKNIFNAKIGSIIVDITSTQIVRGSYAQWNFIGLKYSAAHQSQN